MKKNMIDQIISLLGKVVLLPVLYGEKGCKLNGWNNFTWEDTQKPEHQKMLLRYGNTGVLLGEASGMLITVDCDNDEFLDEFLAANPSMRASLITKGRRGGNVWLKISGQCPKSLRLKRNGTACGEFRSHGNQTIIAGRHPAGMDYRFVNEAAPMEVAYPNIVWPDGIEVGVKSGREGERDSSESLHSESLNPCILVSLYNSPNISAIQITKRFNEDHPSLYTLHESLIFPLLPLEDGSRNSVLTQEIVPRLFGAVAWKAAEIILKYIFDSGQVGGYSLHDAKREIEHAWKALDSEYSSNLTSVERNAYSALEGREQEAFRICRHLAMIEAGPQFPPPRFHLSCANLAARLGLKLSNGKPPCMAADRILKRFTRLYRILREVEKGSAHGHKHRGRATVYEWAIAPLGGKPPAPEETNL